jgi:hypothetical protein
MAHRVERCVQKSAAMASPIIVTRRSNSDDPFKGRVIVGITDDTSSVATESRHRIRELRRIAAEDDQRSRVSPILAHNSQNDAAAVANDDDLLALDPHFRSLRLNAVPRDELVGDIVQVIAHDRRLGADPQKVVADALDQRRVPTGRHRAERVPGVAGDHAQL